MKNYDLFEDLEHYYGRKRTQSYKPSHVCYCFYLYCKNYNKLEKLLKNNIRSKLFFNYCPSFFTFLINF